MLFTEVDHLPFTCGVVAMNVAVITYLYPNDIRVYKEIATLKERHDVEVFLSDTQKTSPKRESVENVVVHRFSHTAYKHTVMRYFFSFIRYLRITKSAIESSPDVCHVHDFTFLPSGILVKMMTRCRLVYDAHEDYASMVFLDDEFRIKLLRTVELFLVRFADRVITVNESLKAYFQPKAKTTVLMNVPALSLYREGAKPFHPSSILVLGYTGHIHRGRGYETLIPLCKTLIEKGIQVEFLLVGGGSFEEEVRHLIREAHLEPYFTLTGEVNHDEMPSFLKRIDIGLILFTPICYNNLIATPNKLFEYMASGIPFVASDMPEMRKIVGGTRSGVLVDPQNMEEIVESILYLVNNPEKAEEMGKNGRKAFETKYNWDVQNQELLTLYEELQ